MTNLYKLMNGVFSYDPKTATQAKGLYFSYCDNIPKVKIAGLTFYKLEDLLSIENLSLTKRNKLLKLQPSESMKLFHISRTTNLYIVRLTQKEEEVLDQLQTEDAQLLEVNKEINSKVGELLKLKKDHEKNIDKLKQTFK